MNANTVTIGNVRLSYCHVFEPYAPQPGADPKYSVTILLPKTDTAALAAVKAAIEAATQNGVARKWGGKMPARLNSPIHDGDGVKERSGEPYGEECKGCWVINASAAADRKPGVYDRNVQPIMDTTEVYSGCYANVNVSFFPYDVNGNRGIGTGLNMLQKVREGEPLGSQVSAAEAFQPLGAETSAPTVPGTDMVYDPLTGGFRKA